MPAWGDRGVKWGRVESVTHVQAQEPLPSRCSWKKSQFWLFPEICVWLRWAESEDGLAAGNTRAVSAALGLAGLAGGHKKPEQA